MSATINFDNHPCFNPRSCSTSGRVHLPVAPRCNLQCKFCNRKFDCMNESRPGVTSAVLKPTQALEYVDKVFARHKNISVVGIAGPGDPMANPVETMETLRLVRAKYPETILCLATNGLALAPHIPEMKELQVSHVTITINAVDAYYMEKIYTWGRDGHHVYRGAELAALMLERQLEGLRKLKEAGIIAKINTIVIPGINDTHVQEIAKKISGMGADIMNCIAFIPVADTEFEEIAPPDSRMMTRMRLQCGELVHQMLHCKRCRADSCGILGEDTPVETNALLQECANPVTEAAKRPCVAVVSEEGIFVNQHLGEASRIFIYRQSEKCATDFECTEIRQAPPKGSGDNRWKELAKRLGDCRAILVNAAGPTPKRSLEEDGIKVVEMDGMIDDGVRSIYENRPLPKSMQRSFTGCSKGVACGGDGQGCG